MPKMSYAQEVAALEETLAALRSRADVVRPLALAVGEELAAQIARIKELKRQQRAYAAEGRATTEALHAEIARGMVTAHDIRSYVVLLYGPKSRRLVQFGIKIRRRPRRKAASPPEVKAEAPGAARDEAWTAHAGRARVAAIGGDAPEVGVDVREIGEEASRIRGNSSDVGAPGLQVGAFPACVGAAASENGGVELPRFGGHFTLCGNRSSPCQRHAPHTVLSSGNKWWNW